MTDTEIAKRLDSLTRRLDALEAAIRSRKDRAGLELRLAVMEREAEAREAAAKKATTTKTPAKKTPAKKGKKAP